MTAHPLVGSTPRTSRLELHVYLVYLLLAAECPGRGPVPVSTQDYYSCTAARYTPGDRCTGNCRLGFYGSPYSICNSTGGWGPIIGNCTKSPGALMVRTQSTVQYMYSVHCTAWPARSVGVLLTYPNTVMLFVCVHFFAVLGCDLWDYDMAHAATDNIRL